MKRILQSRFYTIPEIAEMLSVHPITVKRWIKKGDLKAIRIGRERHISEHALQILLNIPKTN